MSMIPSLPQQTTHRVHKMRFGAEVTGKGTRFKLWAPLCAQVRLRLKGQRKLVPLQRREDGWHRIEIEGIGAGQHYRFVLPDGTEIADPASRHQPGAVDGYSEVVDPAAYEWQDGAWQGLPWEEAVLYELHVGAFTPEGTFTAAAERLPHLRRLGVTAIQLMPLADVYGRFNWGYDGVMWFAPASRYGHPDDLKAFVDAAHRLGIMVMLDVVYNHLGATGNGLPLVAPIFTARHKSPWGDAINFDGRQAETVRELVVESALYWVIEYSLDGLRFDAVHEIADDSTTHILELLAARIRAAQRGRHIHLVTEDMLNEEGWLRRDANGEPVHYTAQWNDDLHHLLHAAITGETTGYYKDYDNLAARRDLLGRALAEGFAYQGEFKPQDRKPRGQPSEGLPPTAFISYMQNHDQIGNRVRGNRICTVAGEDAVLAAVSVFLLAPQIPMLFMGEEWAAQQPFPFFSDLPAALRDATRHGRMEELKDAPEHEDPTKPDVEEALDPTAPSTFALAKLDWSVLDQPDPARRLRLYRSLIDLRHREIVPRMAGMGGYSGRYKTLGDNAVRVSWTMNDGAVLRLYLNLCDESQEGVEPIAGRPIWLQGFHAEGRLGPWTALWTMDVG